MYRVYISGEKATKTDCGFNSFFGCIDSAYSEERIASSVLVYATHADVMLRLVVDVKMVACSK